MAGGASCCAGRAPWRRAPLGAGVFGAATPAVAAATPVEFNVKD
jgi:hypothetical protein